MASADRARALRTQGRRIINLAVGEPDFGTPNEAKLAAVEALLVEDTKYTKVDGTDELKAAIVEKLLRDNQLSYDSGSIIVTNGAKQAIFSALLATVDDGDQVIIPAPYWVSFPEIVRLCGGQPCIVDTRFADGFKLRPEQLEQAISPRTKAVILNSPANPTGAVYSLDELHALGEVLERHSHVLIISDDIYEYIYWSDEPFCNLANACESLRGRVLVVNGVSKSYAMTGWRIGYAAGPQWLISAMRTIQSHSTSNASSISQRAAAAALRLDRKLLQPMVRAFAERHDYVVERLNRIAGVRCRPAQGAFFAFADCGELLSSLGFSSEVDLAERLLEDGGVAVVPGSAYGAAGYLRFSVAASAKELEGGLDAFEQVLEQHVGR